MTIVPSTQEVLHNTTRCWRTIFWPAGVIGPDQNIDFLQCVWLVASCRIIECYQDYFVLATHINGWWRNRSYTRLLSDSPSRWRSPLSPNTERCLSEDRLVAPDAWRWPANPLSEWQRHCTETWSDAWLFVVQHELQMVLKIETADSSELLVKAYMTTVSQRQWLRMNK